MLRQHTEVQLEHPSTGDGYLSGVKEDGKQYAYAFISVTKEEDGPIFMRDMRMVVMDNTILLANWSTKSIPATPGEGSTVINAATGERQTWHPIRGEQTPTRSDRQPSADPTAGTSTASGSNQPMPVVNIAYTPGVHESMTMRGHTPHRARSRDAPGTRYDLHGTHHNQQGGAQQRPMWDGPHRAAQDLPIHILIPDHNETAHLELARVQPWREPWSEEQTVQGVLLERGNILLTTYGPEDNTWATPRRIGTLQYGTLWDYGSNSQGQIWLAKAHEDIAEEVQQWIFKVGKDPWLGAQFIVTNPENIQISGAIREHHDTFLQLRRGQRITAISPPIWIWLDVHRMAGLWCLAATTYNFDTDEYIPRQARVKGGLEPISTLTRC